jgi:hypothetical protein
VASGEGSSRALVAGSVILGTGLFIAIVMVILLAIRPESGPITIAVGPPHPEECPVGSGAPACFRFDVTNTGTTDGVATCATAPVTGTDALFVNGATNVAVRLAPGETKRVYVKVSVVKGDEVVAPMMSCVP